MWAPSSLHTPGSLPNRTTTLSSHCVLLASAVSRLFAAICHHHVSLSHQRASWGTAILLTSTRTTNTSTTSAPATTGTPSAGRWAPTIRTFDLTLELFSTAFLFSIFCYTFFFESTMSSNFCTFSVGFL